MSLSSITPSEKVPVGKDLNITLFYSASRGGRWSIGRQINITDGVQLGDLDEYDELVRQKIEHSANSGAIRRLFSTLAFDVKLLKQNSFIACAAEFLKMLASSFCRSKFSSDFNVLRLMTHNRSINGYTLFSSVS